MQGSRKSEYRSDALEVLHKTMFGLHRHGIIDTATLRHFDLGCLMPLEKEDAACNEASNPAVRRS